MKTFIERVQALATLIAPAIKLIDNSDKFLKPQNLNLYYCYLYIECYYFCYQYKDHFEIAVSLDHKYIPFATDFL